MHIPSKKILLASTSIYRRTILEKTGLSFSIAAPNTDETPHNDESAAELVIRLARQKAASLAKEYPHHFIIGSDQVCVIGNEILGKSYNFDNAYEQLQLANNQMVTFYTGLCLLDSDTDQVQVIYEPFEVKFRKLSAQEIRGYLRLEQPYDCAGSFKCEGLGISLFESLNGRDPNTLIGLPLIALLSMLRKWGINPLTQAKEQA